jgi:hypothetical protein
MPQSPVQSSTQRSAWGIACAAALAMAPALGQDSSALQLYALPAGATPSTSQLGSFSINIIPGSGLSGNSAALAAFNRAAAHWMAYFSDPVTININADLTGGFASANIIGQTSSVLLQAPYTTIRNAMVSDAAGDSFRALDASLPTSAQFGALLPSGYSLSGNLQLTKANAKALGFTGLDGNFGSNDATIQFNNAFNFDYDNSNGVTPGTVDFETVATHELGHALGFISSVDNIDGSASAFADSPTPLDLFRFTNGGVNDPANTSQFATVPRDLRPGSDVLFTDLANNFRFSTGLTQGDGRQASHWKDDGLTGTYIGVMDPTLASGVVEPITAADVKAFALIGWNAQVPEASTWTSLAAVAGMVGIQSWRRRVNRAATPPQG